MGDGDAEHAPDTMTYKTDVVKSLVSNQLAAPVIDVTQVNNGEVNTVYFARLSDKEVVVRISPNSRGHNRFEEEAWAYEKAREAGVKTPQVYKVDTSQSSFDAAYMIAQKLDGESGNEVMKDLSQEQRESIYKKLGAELRKLHSIHIPGFGKLKKEGTGFVGEHSSQWDSIESELRSAWWVQNAVEKGVLTPEQLAGLQERFRKHRDLFNLESSSLVHTDLSRSMKNTIINRESQEITGLIDFENARAGDPAEDVANFTFWGEPNSAEFDAFFEGYDNTVVHGKDFKAKVLLFSLRKAHEMSVYFKDRGDTNAFATVQKKIPFYEAELDKLDAADSSDNIMAIT